MLINYMRYDSKSYADTCFDKNPVASQCLSKLPTKTENTPPENITCMQSSHLHGGGEECKTHAPNRP